MDELVADDGPAEALIEELEAASGPGVGSSREVPCDVA